MKMDAAKIIADELNRGIYTGNVLKYLFDKTDAYEQALTDSQGNLSNDESGIIRLYNIPNLQLSEDEDEEECIGLASDELDRRISEAISIVTFDGDKDRESVPELRISLEAMRSARMLLFLMGVCRN
ncbi:uncharacterized protein LOC113047130 isoform X3 [Carassius auratus]|uniref:Uncharacterized protein LOC113047130 isoform X3 n=1 Tax=Carassius auratus TaxID=7957 RepID=A0A6P6JWB2_CARAU|nr:uncharacterized protein LOC113047130 isoform X3 [Carassius auratus]